MSHNASDTGTIRAGLVQTQVLANPVTHRMLDGPERLHALLMTVAGGEAFHVARVEHRVGQVHHAFPVSWYPPLQVHHHQRSLRFCVREVRQCCGHLHPAFILHIRGHIFQVVGQLEKAAVQERLHIDPVEHLSILVQQLQVGRTEELNLIRGRDVKEICK